MTNSKIKGDSDFFDEKFEEFFVKYSFEEDLKSDLKRFFQEYCYNPKSRESINRGDISRLDFDFLLTFKKVEEYREEIIDYIYDNNLYL